MAPQPTTPAPDLNKLTLDQLIDEEIRYSALCAEAETQRKAIKDALLRKLGEIGFQPGQAYIRERDGVAANIQTKNGTDRIDRMALIMKDVPEEIVDACTIKGKPSAPFVVVRLPKQKAEDLLLGGSANAGTEEYARKQREQ